MLQLEFRKSDVSSGKTEVKQGKFIDLYPQTKAYFREMCKSQKMNPISRTPKFNLGIIQNIIKSLSTIFSAL